MEERTLNIELYKGVIERDYRYNRKPVHFNEADVTRLANAIFATAEYYDEKLDKNSTVIDVLNWFLEDANKSILTEQEKKDLSVLIAPFASMCISIERTEKNGLHYLTFRMYPCGYFSIQIEPSEYLSLKMNKEHSLAMLGL